MTRASLQTALVMVALATTAGVAAAQEAPLLTVQQAVDEALARSPRIVDERDQITQADLGVRLAKNGFRPKVTPNILGSFGRTDLSSQTYRVDVSQKLVTGTELRLGVGTVSEQIPGQAGAGDVQYYNADTTLTLSQPLLRGFGRAVSRYALTSAESQREAAGYQRAATEAGVALEVVAAYYRVVAQESFIDVARQSLDRARKLREASEAKLDAGIVSQLDALRAQQLVSQAELQLFDAQSALEDARDQVRFLIGRESGAPFRVEAAAPANDVEPIDLDRATALALANRIELKLAADNRASANARLAYSRNQLLPQVDVNFNLTRRETADSFKASFGLDGYQFATFLTIAMPVDRTAERVEYERAAIERDRSARQVSVLERQVADEVKRAIRERDRLARTAAAAENAVELGRREVDVAQMRYDTGLSNNLDVVTAEGSLLAAESRRILARAEAAVGRLRLRAALGVFNPRTDISLIAGARP